MNMIALWAMISILFFGFLACNLLSAGIRTRDTKKTFASMIMVFMTALGVFMVGLHWVTGV